ncbi:cytochrome C oxidase subunit IV family protein [uncultured Sphingomonas sp.]|uniref:cytochrome C oxidase subunit IV family protein n=1 Tax=uncultured Sphingomonas sp. TaxID=158754 RepID=UPI002639CE7D|nr:cytochrome C oxidase subunit IV family protein [uncultured Sphingomonas sp.]
MSARATETRRYVTGLLLALTLTGAAFAVVHWPIADRGTTLAAIFALALVQALVHFRCFLHIGPRRSSRDDLILLLFSSLIIVLMVAGTLVVLSNLATRMH